MITPQNVLRHELIGLGILVVSASNPTQVGVSGLVIDETRNMLVIRSNVGLKRIAKNSAIFRFTLPDGTLVDVQGSALVNAPEKRITVQIK
ncbi:MAG: ribonuclease P protein component 1 [Methanoregulaceae archaeon]|nr:ribonuclease P protein component 1 [Methanoregulaceae archaeon]